MATDIDWESLNCATENVARNALRERIALYPSTPDGPLFPLDALGADRYCPPSIAFQSVACNGQEAGGEAWRGGG